jgi:hypothetical protein
MVKLLFWYGIRVRIVVLSVCGLLKNRRAAVRDGLVGLSADQAGDRVAGLWIGSFIAFNHTPPRYSC